MMNPLLRRHMLILVGCLGFDVKNFQYKFYRLHINQMLNF